MDVLSVTGLAGAVAAAAANAAAGDAGRRAWEALLSLWRRHSPEAAGATEIAPEDEGRVQELTADVTERLRQDPSAAEELTRWAEEHGLAPRGDRSAATNIVGGNARIHGPVVQARDINGPLHFG